MRLAYGFVVLLSIVGGCSCEVSVIKPSLPPPVQHLVLNKEAVFDHLVNYDFLIDEKSYTPEEVKQILLRLQSEYCTTVRCVSTTLWSNRKAWETTKYTQSQAYYDLKLNEKQRQNWGKENWVPTCEHQVAQYTAGGEEFSYYPLLDQTYQELEGKKKRNGPQYVSF